MGALTYNYTFLLEGTWSLIFSGQNKSNTAYRKPARFCQKNLLFP